MDLPSLPRGFRLAGVHCGIKPDPRKEDLALIFSDRPAAAAGVYTQNRIVAAPVKLCRNRTPADSMRAMVINSGNANACTGEQGDRDASRSAQRVAEACQLSDDEVLVLSTGVIGELLPMPKIEKGIRDAAAALAQDAASITSAARGMMTTDTVPKIRGKEISAGDASVRLIGLAKGAAMIGPNMATMLAVIMTDAKLDPDTAQKMLHDVVDDSFNSISVEGHTSTNDSVVLLANGAAMPEPLGGDALARFQSALKETCEQLAQAIVDDGEGATHRITINVHGCGSPDEARCIAKSVANSVLVKTAVTGGDPNWGRIVSAAGYSGVAFDPAGVSLSINGTVLYEQGRPIEFDESIVSQSIRDHRETRIDLSFGEGTESARFWSTDLTAEYVRLNADYRT